MASRIIDYSRNSGIVHLMAIDDMHARCRAFQRNICSRAFLVLTRPTTTFMRQSQT